MTVVLGGFGAKLADVEDNETVNWLPGSAESTQALEKVTAFRSDTTLDAVIVYERDGGITADDVAAAQADIAEFEEMNGRTVGEVVGDDSVAEAETEITIDGQVEFIPPEASTDGEAMQVVVPIDAGKDGWLIMPDLADHMRDIAETDANGMTTHLAGYAGLAADQAEAFESIDGALLLAALGVVIIILLITYRSPILWLFPVICVVFALFSAQGVIYLLAKYADLTVNAQTRSILSVLVLGAGTDYALLLVARYREELRRHHDRHEAMTEALHRAGPAIIASGSTVIVGMLCLVVADMNSTQQHGSGARHRRGRRPAGDDHPAAGAAGDHGPLDLLAGEADRGKPRADLDGLLGQDRLGDQPPATHGLDQHVPRPRRHGSRHRDARRHGAQQRRAVRRHPRLGQGRAGHRGALRLRW